MEVAAAVGVIVSVPILYKAIRPRLKFGVECWFCHETTKVPYANRNSFTCPSCEQYNGFTEDGDYNQRIPGQAYTVPKRFCVPVKMEKQREGLLDRLGGVNMSPKAANGLCSECNLGQEIIMKKVADFEPINEDRWNEELEDYRYKLERTYQLCPRCTIQIHGKLEEDKKKYSYLFDMKYKLKHAIGSTLKEAIGSTKKKSRKLFFAGGTVCESLHFGSLGLLLVLFLATIDFLQQDAGVSLITVPKHFQDHLPVVYTSAMSINAMVFILHIFAAFNNKCRVTLPDLLLPILLIISMLALLISNSDLSQDVALVRCACASFSTILSMAVTLLPRKKLHKKKANRIISSAFSVASTPISQCSSQNSRNASLLDHDNTVYNRSRQSPYQSSPVGISSSSPGLRDVTNIPSWETRQEKENDNGEAMEWDDSESIAQSTRTAQSHFKPGLLGRSRGLNGLTPSVANMSIMGSMRPIDSPPTPSVFSRQHRQIIQQQQNMTPARSLFGTARSLAPSNIERNYFVSDAMTRSGSVFTSVSQQDGMSAGSEWQCRVIMILFAIIFIMLIMQTAVFYYVFITPK